MEYIYPLVGGLLIGLASALILGVQGKIMGISGILSTFLSKKIINENWKVFFILGMVITGFILKNFLPSFFNYKIEGSLLKVVIAGLLVGFGTRLGSGCTSGHGVCGIPRLSLRSITATVTFIIFGIITVYIQGVI